MTLRGQSSGSIRAWRRYFPVSSIGSVVELMNEILFNAGIHCSDTQSLVSQVADVPPQPGSLNRWWNNGPFEVRGPTPCVLEPDLAFVSIVLGYIENHLTIPGLEESLVSNKPKIVNPVASKSSSSRSLTSSTTSGARIPPSPLSVYSTESQDASPAADQILSVFSCHSEKNFVGRESLAERDGNHFSFGLSSITPTRVPLKPHRLRTRHWRTPHRRISSSDANTSDTLLASLRFGNDSRISSSSDQNSSCKRRRFSDTAVSKSTFPCLTFEEAERLYQDFHSFIMTSAKLQPYIRSSSASKTNESSGQSLGAVNGAPQYATRTLIRTVCEVLWNRMSSGKHKEKVTHTQSVYSFLTAGILDSFGLAYTTVAACQLLGYSDVDLTLSEDHGWVEFGPSESRQSADVASWVHTMHHLTPAQDTLEVRARPSSGLDESETKVCQSDEDSDSWTNLPPIRMPPLRHSWLYVNGYPVVCRPRIIAVAAAVAALQPGATTVPSMLQAPLSAPAAYSPSVYDSPPTTDLIIPDGLARHLSSCPAISMQLVSLKHRLLWLFYHAGCLARYPLGLTNLADLEDAFPSSSSLSCSVNCLNTLPLPPPPAPPQDLQNNTDLGSPETDAVHGTPTVRPSSSPSNLSVPLRLYSEAVHVTQRHYANQHVYPYTCLAGYLYRHDNHRGALRYWSEAAQVIGQYNHSSEDWEIYRELLEIATQLMPHMFRFAAEASRSCSEGSVEADPDGCLFQPANILDDPQCLAYLLAFYDHLCLWEEGSPVPVLHVGWVDKLMVNLARFSQRARRLLCLSVSESKLTRKENESIHSPASRQRSDNIGPSSPASSCASNSRRRRTRTSSSHWPDPSGPLPSATILTSGTSDLSQPLKVDTTPLISCTSPPCSSPSLVLPGQTVTPKQDPIATTVANVESRSKTAPKNKKLSENSALKVPRVDAHAQQPPSTLPMYETSCYNNLTTSTTTVDTHASEVIQKVLPDLEVAEALAGLYEESDNKCDATAELEDEDASPSPPPVAEFPNNDDLLATLVEACDHRLLNPAYLLGVEPNMPFLPANVAPEDAFTRLLSCLEADVLTISQPASLFPTPPNSGSMCGANDELMSPDNMSSSPSRKLTTPIDGDVNLTKDPITSDVLSTDQPTKPECPATVDMIDGSTLLDQTSHGLIDSVTDVVSLQATPTDGYKPSSSETDLLELILKTEQSINDDMRSADQIPTSMHGRPCKTMDELTVHLTLHSIKMISIVELLRASRLNASAIKLALTAQSQVSLRRTGLSSVYDT